VIYESWTFPSFHLKRTAKVDRLSWIDYHGHGRCLLLLVMRNESRTFSSFHVKRTAKVDRLSSWIDCRDCLDFYCLAFVGNVLPLGYGGSPQVSTTELYKSTMELSDELYSHNPSEVRPPEARQILKDGLSSVIISKLAFDAFKKFNTEASEHDSPENPLPDGIHKSVVALLDDELTKGEVPFTKAFCKDSNQGVGKKSRLDRAWT
jgi:hypothetical protein